MEFGDSASSPEAGSGTSAAVRERVAAARARQAERWGKGPAALNGLVEPGALRRRADATPEAFAALEAAQSVGALSARALDRVLRVARTLADLAGSERVEVSHVVDAANYRGLDKIRAYLRDKR